jgi:hypothetical protein
VDAAVDALDVVNAHASGADDGNAQVLAHGVSF